MQKYWRVPGRGEAKSKKKKKKKTKKKKKKKERKKEGQTHRAEKGLIVMGTLHIRIHKSKTPTEARKVDGRHLHTSHHEVTEKRLHEHCHGGNLDRDMRLHYGRRPATSAISLSPCLIGRCPYFWHISAPDKVPQKDHL
jgi:hypothetical protein